MSRPFHFSLMTRDRLARLVISLSQPDLGAAVREEVGANTFKDEAPTNALPQHVLVESCDSPVTIFAFASSALLFAGQPTFEFRGLLKPKQGEYNLVFFRDIYRLAYHVTPDGEPSGLEFYESEIRELMRKLGSKVHIAIGDSAGGAAAIYFGTRCGMDKAIAFSSPFPTTAWTSLASYWHTLTNFKVLFRSPYEYWEVAFLSAVTAMVNAQLRGAVGRDNIWNPVRTYIEAAKRPKATIFFGEGCKPDARVAEMLAPAPEAKLVPLPTARHNSAICLAKRGKLRSVIEEEIAESVKAAGISDAELRSLSVTKK